MMHARAIGALALLLTLLSTSGCRARPAPPTDVNDEPYDWLERASPRRETWARAYDARGRAELARLPERERLREGVAAVARSEVTLTPVRGGERLFFLRTDAAMSRRSLFVLDPLVGEPRRLLDGDALAAQGDTLAQSLWPSDDGGRVAYAVGAAVDRRVELRLVDAERGAVLPDRLAGLSRATPQVAWAADGASLAWAPAEGGNVYYHRVGGASPDRVLVAEDGAEIAGLSRRDGRDEFVVVVRRGERTAALLVDAAGGVRRVVPEGEGELSYVGAAGDGLLFTTTRQAPRGRVVRANADGALVDVVREGEHIIETWPGGGPNAVIAGGALFVIYRASGLAELRQFDLTGRRVRVISPPGAGVIWSGLRARPGDSHLFFSHTGFVDPGTVYRLETTTGRLEVFARPALPYDTGEVVTEQSSYPSPSGVRAPMMIVRHRATHPDGTRPTLIFGYGWGGWIAGPWFRPHLYEWLRRGGVFALPALRGGGELGAEWARAGVGHHRQNAIDDYHAACRTLVDAGWTAPNQIVAEGQSAGASLAAAAVVQAPSGFGALLLAYPVLDMMGYERDPSARRWRGEFGTVDDERDRQALAAWSPLRNLRRGRCYPPTLVMPGELDPSAAPFHGYKYAAKLADVQGCSRRVMLRVAWGAGHAYGKDVDDTVDSYADQLAFALQAITPSAGVPTPP